MKTKFTMAVLVMILATIFVANFASASLLDVRNTKVQVNNRFAGPDHVAVEAGKTYPVEVWFTAKEDASDVKFSAWIESERSETFAEKELSDVIVDGKYNGRLAVTMPENLDDTEEFMTLIMRVESDSGSFEIEKTLLVQRQSNNLEIELVDMDNQVKFGESLDVEVALKNNGRQVAEDIKVDVKIPALDISRTTFFEDLYPMNYDFDDMDNSREKTISLNIPENANKGIYAVEVVARSDETESKVTKKLKVVENEVEANLLTNPSSKTFSVGSEEVYDLEIVNSGNEIEVFNLEPQTSEDLEVSLGQNSVAVPAGDSKTVKVYAKANEEGNFNFAVRATSNSFSETAQFSATTERNTITGGNNVFALTIVLAIILVVLLIVLIVLLTRKPERTEEFGESYY